LLLATMAAVADENGVVRDLSAEELSSAAGISDRTYRRARKQLLATTEIALLRGTGGRGNTNVWSVIDPHVAGTAEPVRAARRVPPPAGARPLLASTNGGQDRTVVRGKGPILTGVSPPKGGQDRMLFELLPSETPAQRGAQTPAETPAATPASHARRRDERRNPRTGEHPPDPPEGGRPARSIMIEQTYVTDRGRHRKRTVRVDLDEVRRSLGLPTADDRRDWQRIRDLLRARVGDSSFEIWLEPIELIAVDSQRALLVDTRQAIAGWARSRYGGLIASCACEAGRPLRFAEETQRHAVADSFETTNRKEVAG
jgi:hypothetical protein